MAEIGAAVVGGGVALAVAGYSNGTGFVARHETAHAQQVTEMKRIIADFEEAYKREEVSEQDWNRFLAIRNKARATEADYEESIEDYKRAPVYKFIRKWKKLHQVRKKKGKLRSVNREMRLHYYDSTSDASDTSSITAESGSPPRKSPRLNRYSDEDEDRVLSWANKVASESDDENPMVVEERKKDDDLPVVHKEQLPVVHKKQLEKCVYIEWKHQSRFHAVSFSPDGQAVLSGDAHSIRVLNCATGTHVKNRLEVATSHDIKSMTFSPNCEMVVANCRKGAILLWDSHTGRLLSKLKLQRRDDNERWGSWNLVFTVDGKRVMSLSCEDATVQLLDIDSGQSTSCPLEGAHRVSPFKPSSDSTRVAFSSGNNVLISDLHTGKNIAGPMRGHTGIISTLTFSSDDSLVVSGSTDKTIRLWDSRTGKAAFSKPLSGHTNCVQGIDISSDGRRIVSGSADSTVRIWDTRIGKTLEMLEGHDSTITRVVFSPDGSKVASGSFDGTVRLWDISAREWNKNTGIRLVMSR